MSVGSRYDSSTDDDYIELLWQLIHNGFPTNAYSMVKVETFALYSDAVSGMNILQTIVPPNIINVGTGLYKYDINTPVSEGTYFDKVTFIPKLGYNQQESISAYYVREDQWSGSPSEIPQRCQVSGYILNELGDPVQDAIVSAQLLKANRGGEYYVLNNVKMTRTNEIGFFTLNLIRSTEFSPNIRYEFDIRYGSYREKFIKTIPNIGGINFIDLV